MSSDVVLKVENVSKCFEMYEKPMHRLLQTLCAGHKKFYKEFWALRDINFEIRKGECVGIIGRNGAGKSTLLQIITGTLLPSGGDIDVKGKVAALLELGSGFNPEFTGRENVYMNASVLGLNQQEIEEKYQEIVDFADIGDFINQPVKNYSSGMVARLAFSVAVNVSPEIFIVDESLSVGDMLFQAKAIQKMKDLMANATVLFVSHDLSLVKSFCSKAIYLKNSTVHMTGPATQVCDAYIRDMHNEIAAVKSLDEILDDGSQSAEKPALELAEVADPDFPESGEVFRSGSRCGEFVRGDLIVNGEISKTMRFGDKVTFRLLIHAKQDIPEGALVGYMISNSNGVEVFGRNLYNDKKSLPALPANTFAEVCFSFKCLLQGGNYSISIGFKGKPIVPNFYDQISVARTFQVEMIPGNYVPGIMYVENDIEIRTIQQSGKYETV